MTGAMIAPTRTYNHASESASSNQRPHRGKRSKKATSPSHNMNPMNQQANGPIASRRATRYVATSQQATVMPKDIHSCAVHGSE